MCEAEPRGGGAEARGRGDEDEAEGVKTASLLWAGGTAATG